MTTSQTEGTVNENILKPLTKQQLIDHFSHASCKNPDPQYGFDAFWEWTETGSSFSSSQTMEQAPALKLYVLTSRSYRLYDKPILRLIETINKETRHQLRLNSSSVYLLMSIPTVNESKDPFAVNTTILDGDGFGSFYFRGCDLLKHATSSANKEKFNIQIDDFNPFLTLKFNIKIPDANEALDRLTISEAFFPNDANNEVLTRSTSQKTILQRELSGGSYRSSKNTKKNESDQNKNRKLAIRQNLTLKFKGHALKKPNKGKFKLCGVCHQKTNKPVYQCKYCQMSVHTASIKGVLVQCVGLAKSEDIIPQENVKLKANLRNVGSRNEATLKSPHSFEDSKSSKHMCGHCGDNFGIFGEKHKKCTMCSKHYHNRCALLVPPMCGIDPELIKSLTTTVSKMESNIGLANNKNKPAKTINNAHNNKLNVNESTGFYNTMVPQTISTPQPGSFLAAADSGIYDQGFAPANNNSNDAMATYESAEANYNNQDIYDICDSNENISNAQQVKKIERQLALEMFSIVKLLGEGAFGIVYKANYTPNNKILAVKCQKLDLDDDQIMDALVFELHVMKKVYQSQYTIDFYGSFVTNGYVFMAMLICPGGTLCEIIEQEKNLSIDVIRVAIAQQFLAVEFIHKEKIIMRDIKSDNIMVDEKGRTRLCDFGLSKDLSANKGDEECFTFCGTPEYMSPEVAVLQLDPERVTLRLPQFLAKRSYSYECDWWSLSITMYEMMHGGEMPYIEATDPAKRVDTVIRILTSPREFALKVSGPLQDAFLRRMLKKDLGKRLGPKENIETVGYYRDDPFFKDIDWDKLQNTDYVGPFKETLIVESVKANGPEPPARNRRKSKVQWPSSDEVISEDAQCQLKSFSFCSEWLEVK